MFMFKVKYFFITFSFIYMLFTFGCLLFELNNVSNTNKQIMRTVSLASDMAIQQAVASDEMFNNLTSNSTISRNDVSAYTSIRIAKNGDIKYDTANIFALTYNGNKPIENDDDKEKLFKTMFFNNSNSLLVGNKNFLRDVCKITTLINGDFVPVIVQTGMLQEGTNISISDIYSGGTPTWYSNYSIYYNDAKKMMSATDADYLGAYHIKKVYKYSNYDSNVLQEKEETYFLAPSNVGVTYIDPKILQNAFISNMDLIMRADLETKTTETEGVTLGGLTRKEGIGALIGFEGDAVTVNPDVQDKLKMYNVIYNDNMVYVKGKFDLGNGGYACEANNYCKPQIDYMVLDLCTANTDEQAILGVALGLPNKVRSSKEEYEEWLKGLGLDPKKETLTENDDHRYVSVARVTTYADVSISISTPIGRQLNSMYSRYLRGQKEMPDYADFGEFKNVQNLLDMHCFPVTNADKEKYKQNCDTAKIQPKYSGLTGNPLYVYTSYYAIM